MTNFASFASALLGGVLIGVAANFLLGTLGRVAGISGIVGNLVSLRRAPEGWRLGFVMGLVAIGALLLGKAEYSSASLAPSTAIVAGLLVGFGTRLGNGCTSGHGVCGVSRFSRRSLVATGTFMVTAAVVVVLTRHVLGGLH